MNKDIYIWGAGVYGEKTLRDCKERGINIAGFIDSNETLWNTEKFGTVIYPPKEVLQKQNVEILIAIANKFTSVEISEICKNADVEFSISSVIKKQFTVNLVQLDGLRRDVLYKFQNCTYLSVKDTDRLFELGGQHQLHFSAQYAQDIVAYLFFKGKTDGFYIDIGANDGFSGSTTYWAEQIGWKGICVEPQKNVFERMKKARKCAIYNCAVSNCSQESVEFIMFPGIDTRSGLADSMSQSHIEAAKTFSNMEKTFVSTKTFGNIMNDFPNVSYVDFLSVDTEGHEMQVLQSIDFEKFKFGLIAIETTDGSDVAQFVENSGYKKLMVAGSDILFVPKSYKIPVCCAIYPFESNLNKYTDVMKDILETINIKPISIDNYEYADFIWLHWFESITDESDFQQKIVFLEKCKSSGKKIIWNVHNKKPHETLNIENVENIMKLLAQLSYKIVIHSHITIDVIKDVCGDDKDTLSKIIFVPHPHYAGAYGDLTTTNLLQNNKLKILFFGQIRPYKNIEILINVFNDLNFDDMELSICGLCVNKEYERNLLNLIGCDKNVKTDFRFIADSEIPYLLANNHVLTLPYSIESMLNSGTIILAFSYARTVISPNIGTIDEISDKSLFFSYDYKSEEEHEQKFKKQIIAIREKYLGKYNELLNLGEKCRKYILENNSYLKTAEQLALAFDEE